MDIADLIGTFSEKFGVLFRPASPTEVAAAASAGVPETLLKFYRDYEPNEAGKEQIRFFPLERVVAEMTDFVPSCHLSRHGYFGFAGTNHGDVFLSDQPVEAITANCQFTCSAMRSTILACHLRRSKSLALLLLKVFLTFSQKRSSVNLKPILSMRNHSSEPALFAIH